MTATIERRQTPRLRPGTPLHAETVHAYKAAVDRLAKMRALEADLPGRIHEEQKRIEDLAQRLGLKSGRSRHPLSRSKETRPLVIGALLDGPATPSVIADRTGLRIGLVTSMLGVLKRQGIAKKDGDYGSTWSLTEPGAHQ